MSDNPEIISTPDISPKELRKLTKISEDFYSVYCNHVRIAMSESDFRFFIGEAYPTSIGEINLTENHCVVMAPGQAKATLELLTNLIAAYENKFGSIKKITQTLPILEIKSETPDKPAKP